MPLGLFLHDCLTGQFLDCTLLNTTFYKDKTKPAERQGRKATGLK